MPNTIKAGTILIAENALLPASLGIESEPYIYGWRRVKNADVDGLDQMIGRAGWNFFYLAETLEANVFGSDEKKTVRKAMKQIVEKLKSKKFNCLEIKQVITKRSWGLPTVFISAHSRHIQQDLALAGS